MAVRTFYWDPVVRGLRRYISRPSFRTGNAGDLLNRDLVRHLYNVEPQNVEHGGRRLLLVGSVIHRMEDGDIVTGVGTKGVTVPSPRETGEVDIRGVRGPITQEALDKAGHDVSRIAFHADPGLLVQELYPMESGQLPVPGRGIFIPHYRDRAEYRRLQDIKVIDIDCQPSQLASEIAQAEYVLTSSLHGLIFAHAIGRPVRLIAPIHSEPMIKYEDYVASVGLVWRKPVDIETALRESKPDSPEDITFDRGAVKFPTYEELRSNRVAE